MVYGERQLDDVDELSTLFHRGGWETRLVQLTPGPLGFASTGVSVPGLSVHFLRYGQGLLFQEALSGPLLNLSFLLEASSPVRLAGRELGAREMVVRGDGDQSEYASARAAASLSITLDPGLIGWPDPPRGRVALAAGDRLRRDLVTACRLWIAAARAQPALGRLDGGDPFGPAGHRVLDRIRDLLAGGLQPAVEASTDLDRQQLVRRARRRLAEGGPAPSVPALARELGASERTLFRAFQQCLGVGPREFDQARRLHQLRTRLLELGPGRGHVARAAAEAGFSHLGRLSRVYRDHFGELPSETVNRRDRDRPSPGRSLPRHGPIGRIRTRSPRAVS